MEYKILEENGVENKNVDGAAFNNFSAGGKSGVVAGVLDQCKITYTSNKISIGTGLLLIHGIRIKILSPEVLSISGVPAADINYKIIARVVLAQDESITFSIQMRTDGSLVQEPLYEHEKGTYELELGKFTHLSSSGWIDNAVRTCEVLTNPAGSGGEVDNINKFIDPTLSKLGFAADAFATGEAYKDLLKKITEGVTIKEVKYINTTNEGNLYQFILSDETTSDFLYFTAPKGDKGEKGEKGEKGDTGAKVENVSYEGKTEDGNYNYKLTLDTGEEFTFVVPKTPVAIEPLYEHSFLLSQGIGSKSAPLKVKIISAKSDEFTIETLKEYLWDFGAYYDTTSDSSVTENKLFTINGSGNNTCYPVITSGLTEYQEVAIVNSTRKGYSTTIRSLYSKTNGTHTELYFGKTYTYIKYSSLQPIGTPNGSSLENYYTKEEVDDKIANINSEIGILGKALLQSTIMYKVDTVDRYNERITAGGLNILNESKALLKEVVGETVRCKQVAQIAGLNFNKGSINVNVSNDGRNIIFTNTSISANYKNSLNVSYLHLKPNTTYTSKAKVKFTVNTAGGQSGGSMSVGLLLQKNDTFSSEEKFYIFGSNSTPSSTREQVVISNFTTPSDLTGYNYFVTRITGGTTVEYQDLMLVEGSYTENNFPEYQSYFNGLKSAIFAGIESSNSNGTQNDIFNFQTIEMPLGKSIDFENGIITDYGTTNVFTGAESWTLNSQATAEGWGNCYQLTLPHIIDSSKVPIITENYEYIQNIDEFASKTNVFYMSGTTLIIKTNGTQILEDWESFLVQRNNALNPVAIRYVTTTIQNETEFLVDANSNKYTVWTNGEEKVKGNSNSIYGANNTLTQNYIIVKEIN